MDGFVLEFSVSRAGQVPRRSCRGLVRANDLDFGLRMARSARSGARWTRCKDPLASKLVRLRRIITIAKQDCTVASVGQLWICKRSGQGFGNGAQLVARSPPGHADGADADGNLLRGVSSMPACWGSTRWHMVCASDTQHACRVACDVRMLDISDCW